MNLEKVPQHVGIIMDGNVRWAAVNGYSKRDAYNKGVSVAVSIAKSSIECGVKYLTLFVFSTENWGRPQMDIQLLFALFEEKGLEFLNEICESGIRVRLIGERSALESSVRSVIEMLESETKSNQKLHLNLAINYGGRNEIVMAIRKMVEQGVKATEITDQMLCSYLYTSGMPDPDLIIRTAGDMRLSNFLLWQSSYSELYFTNVLWPDFNDNEFKTALLAYQSRTRRYGK